MLSGLELPDFRPTSPLRMPDAVRDPAFAYEVGEGPLGVDEVARVLFAAQGCTGRAWGRCLRAAPSAGATYPLQLYVAVNHVEGVEPGVYKYVSPAPFKHMLAPVEQRLPPGRGAVTVYIEEISERTTSVYGERGYMYVREEVGHAVQGAMLECSILGLAARLRALEPPVGRVRYCIDVGPRGRRLSERGVAAGRLPEPAPALLTLEEAIAARRSVRRYRREPLSLSEVSALLSWSLQGEPRPYQPPAGRYEVECYLVVRDVKGLEPGVYRYLPGENDLEMAASGDRSRRLAEACLGQEWVARAALNVVLSSRGGEAAEVEAGMVGQGIYLAATSLRLGTVAVGAFYDDEVASELGARGRPLYVLPVGRP